MIKYARIINQETGLCEVGTGTNIDFYKSLGMVELDVDKSEKDGQWYITEKCPHYTEEELLEQAKEDKLKENETIRDEFLVSGVIYKDILWDSDLEQKLNISVQVANMSDEDIITWVAMDGVTSLECSKLDLLNIGALLTQMTAYVWQYKNPEIKTAIANAQTMEELEAIEIVYSLEEINIEPDNIEEVGEL